MISERQKQFNELMVQYDREMEVIAGQPDINPEPINKDLSYGEYMLNNYPHGPQGDEPIDQFPSPVEDDEASRQAEYAATRKKYATDKAVDRPSHYEFAGTTVQKMLEQYLTHDQLVGWFRGNILKYRMRAFKKNNLGSQDIAKADKYQELWDDYVKRNTP